MSKTAAKPGKLERAVYSSRQSPKVNGFHETDT